MLKKKAASFDAAILSQTTHGAPGAPLQSRILHGRKSEIGQYASPSMIRASVIKSNV
jgi:hypothetical protein